MNKSTYKEYLFLMIVWPCMQLVVDIFHGKYEYVKFGSFPTLAVEYSLLHEEVLNSKDLCQPRDFRNPSKILFMTNSFSLLEYHRRYLCGNSSFIYDCYWSFVPSGSLLWVLFFHWWVLMAVSICSTIFYHINPDGSHVKTLCYFNALWFKLWDHMSHVINLTMDSNFN